MLEKNKQTVEDLSKIYSNLHYEKVFIEAVETLYNSNYNINNKDKLISDLNNILESLGLSFKKINELKKHRTIEISEHEVILIKKSLTEVENKIYDFNVNLLNSSKLKNDAKPYSLKAFSKNEAIQKINSFDELFSVLMWNSSFITAFNSAIKMNDQALISEYYQINGLMNVLNKLNHDALMAARILKGEIKANINFSFDLDAMQNMKNILEGKRNVFVNKVKQAEQQQISKDLDELKHVYNKLNNIQKMLDKSLFKANFSKLVGEDVAKLYSDEEINAIYLKINEDTTVKNKFNRLNKEFEEIKNDIKNNKITDDLLNHKLEVLNNELKNLKIAIENKVMALTANKTLESIKKQNDDLKPLADKVKQKEEDLKNDGYEFKTVKNENGEDVVTYVKKEEPSDNKAQEQLNKQTPIKKSNKKRNAFIASNLIIGGLFVALLLTSIFTFGVGGIIAVAVIGAAAITATNIGIKFGMKNKSEVKPYVNYQNNIEPDNNNKFQNLIKNQEKSKSKSKRR